MTDGTASEFSGLAIEPLHPALGAEVRGLDLGEEYAPIGKEIEKACLKT